MTSPTSPTRRRLWPRRIRSEPVRSGGVVPAYLRHPRSRYAAEVLVVAGLVGLVVSQWGTVSRSFTVVGHADWRRLLLALFLEWVSMVTFARTQRVVLGAAGIRMSLPSMIATTFAGNAISMSLPLIGPGAGTAFAFRRFQRVAGDGAKVLWALAVSGLVSSLAWLFILAAGAAVSDNTAAIASGLAGGAAVIGLTVVGVLALTHRGLRTRLIGWAARLVALAQRWTGHPEGDPLELVRGGVGQLLAVRMSSRHWAGALALSLVNWLASLGCLIASIRAVGAHVPWESILLVYCVGAAAASFGVTPGGLGVVEAALTASLVAAKMPATQAFGAVLIYRLITFWLVTLVGWVIYALIPRAHREIAPRQSKPDSTEDADEGERT